MSNSSSSAGQQQWRAGSNGPSSVAESSNKQKSVTDRVQGSAKLRASSPAFQPSLSKVRQKAVATASTIANKLPTAVYSHRSDSNGSANSNSNSSNSSSRDMKDEHEDLSAKAVRNDNAMAQLQSGIAKARISWEAQRASDTAKDTANDDDFFLMEPAPGNSKEYMKPVGHFAIDEGLRRMLTEEARMTDHVVESELPFQVHNYHSLSPLETVQVAYNMSGSVTQHEIKAQSIADGNHYSLHRIPSLDLTKSPNLGAIDRWRVVNSPNVARVHEAFTTRAFGDNSLVVVYDYKPMASSLKRTLVDNRAPVTEALLWSIVLQVVSGLRAIHAAGLAVHTLDLATVSMSPTGRVYLNSCGLADVLGAFASYNIEAALQNDLHAVGNMLVVILAMNRENVVAVQGQSPVVMPGPSFTTDFKELFGYLNRRLTPVIAIDDILRLAGSRVFLELDAARRETDLLSRNLRLEMANGRLARLVCKINFITERTDSVMDPEWSETGDRYLIKLFRDYVFHLVSEDGRPVVDMAHVVGNLNKLDAGSTERVMLMSRDEKSCLVVSYAELKRCIDAAYQELLNSQPKQWRN
ncbi:PAB-dependent poly(A)-specific ribonuclease subunit 3 [Coemansia sp. RSA 1200]|nr:PAB-dependent poly(A)-specific ribonuclease subunit 3 [Coemansia sp. RSA 1200]